MRCLVLCSECSRGRAVYCHTCTCTRPRVYRLTREPPPNNALLHTPAQLYMYGRARVLPRLATGDAACLAGLVRSDGSAPAPGAGARSGPAPGSRSLVAQHMHCAVRLLQQRKLTWYLQTRSHCTQHAYMWEHALTQATKEDASGGGRRRVLERDVLCTPVVQRLKQMCAARATAGRGLTAAHPAATAAPPAGSRAPFAWRPRARAAPPAAPAFARWSCST